MKIAGSVLIVVYGIQLLWWRTGTSNSLCVAAKTLLSGGILFMVICGAARTISRNRDWQSRESLLRSGLSTLPHNAKMHYNFANFLRDSNRQDDAIHHYNEALRLWPSYASAHNNLGTLVVSSGRAEHHFLEAIRFSKDHVNAHYNLGKLYRKDNRSAESLAMLGRCVWLEPRFVPAWLEIVQLTTPTDRGPLYRKIISLQPNIWEHYIRYAQWLETRGLPRKALKMYIHAMRASDRIPSTDSIERETALYSKRGALQGLRGACLLLRTQGQRSRILQFVTRWHAREAKSAVSARDIYLNAWARRRELAGRAERYANRSPSVSRTTCLDHVALERPVAPNDRGRRRSSRPSRPALRTESESVLFAKERNSTEFYCNNTAYSHSEHARCNKTLTIEHRSSRTLVRKHNDSYDFKVAHGKRCCSLNSLKVCQKARCKLKVSYSRAFNNKRKEYASESVSAWLGQHILDSL